MVNPYEILEKRLVRIERLLINIQQSQQETLPVSDPETWFSLNELCQYLPDKPKKATVYTWVRENSIPYHKGAKKLRFLKREIDEWLKGQRRNTLAEINQEADNYIKANVITKNN